MLFRHGQNRTPAALMRIDFIVVLSIFIAGLTLRLFRIDHQSLWLDEVSSLRNAKAFGEGGVLALASVDQVAPLHSIVLWLSTLIGGHDAFSLRLPSAIAGALMVPAMYALATRLSFDRSVTYAACLFVALAPMTIWYSQDARMYIFVMLCSTVYIAIAWPILWRDLTSIEVASLFLVAVAGLGFHHYMAFVVILFGLFLLARGLFFQKRFWIFSLTQLGAALVFSAWMLLTLDRIGGFAGSVKSNTIFWLPYTIYSFFLGFSLGPSPREIAISGANVAAYSAFDMLVVLFSGIALVALLAYVAVRNGRSAHLHRSLFLWAWFLVPPVLAVGMTFLTKVQFNVRYTVVSFPAFALLMAIGICGLCRLVANWKWQGAEPGLRSRIRTYGPLAVLAIISTMITLSVLNHYFNERYTKEDSRALSAFLRAESAGATLVSDNARVLKMLGYYQAPSPSEASTIDYRWTDSTPDSVIRNLKAEISGPKPRVILIEYRSWESDRNHVLRQRLEGMGTLLKRASFPGIEVFEFAITTPAG